MNKLTIQHVTKQFSGHTALNGVSFDIPEGSIYGLLGPNGAGKTTLIRIINMITRADTGDILLDDRLVIPSDVSRIGYLPEERGLYSKMKVLDQLVFFGKLKGKKGPEARKTALKWLEKLGLMEWRFKKAEELSKGMQQKVQFIITVMHEPELIILDEPFTGFDPINVELIKNEIKRLRDAGATVIFSTHRMESVEEICDHMGMINKSEKVLEGRIDQIKDRYRTGMMEVRFETADVSGVNGFNSLKETAPGKYTALIDAGQNKKEVIRTLNEKVNLLSFKELLPSIHEIFIQKVKEGENA